MTSLQTRVSKRLELLGCPPVDVSRLTGEAVQAMVAFLEDSCIRFWAEDQRGPLRGGDLAAWCADAAPKTVRARYLTLSSPQLLALAGASNLHLWWGVFHEYCLEVGITDAVWDGKAPELHGGVVDPARNPEVFMVVDWLISRAVRCQFQDSADETNEAHQKYLRVQKTAIASAVSTQVENLAESKPILDNLLALGIPTSSDMPCHVSWAPFTCRGQALHADCDCGLPASFPAPHTVHQEAHEDPEAALATVNPTITRVFRMLEVVREQSTKAGKAPASEQDLRKMFDSLPSGLSLNDPQLDQFVRVLRVLFTSDLRELQDIIDNALLEFQSLTEDPKTDARLGRVGS
eukprot:gene4103-746_t